MQKRHIVILFSVLASLFVLIAVGVGSAASKLIQANRDCAAYVDDVTPKILANLNKETLWSYADDKMKRSASNEEINQVFACYKKLGTFQRCDKSIGTANIWSTSSGTTITGRYTARAYFSNGPASVSVWATKSNGKWSISGFRINSMALQRQ